MSASNDQQTRPPPQIIYSVKNVMVHPSNDVSTFIDGTLVLVRIYDSCQDGILHLQWSPDQENSSAPSAPPTPGNSISCSTSQDQVRLKTMYTFSIPYRHVIGVRMSTRRFTTHRVLLLIQGNVPLQPLFFHKGGVRHLALELQRHSRLLRSTSDPDFYDVIHEAKEDDSEGPLFECYLQNLVWETPDTEAASHVNHAAPSPQPQPQSPVARTESTLSLSGLSKAFTITKETAAIYGNWLKTQANSAYEKSKGDRDAMFEEEPNLDAQGRQTTLSTEAPTAAVGGDARCTDGRTTPTSDALFLSPSNVPTEFGDFEFLPRASSQSLSASGAAVWRGEPLDPLRWATLLDSAGRVTEPTVVKLLVFRGGIAPSLRAEVWPFLLGLYPWSSTAQDRLTILAEKRAEYEVYRSQWSSITPAQAERNFSFRDRQHRIHKDVIRTDRTQPQYADLDGRHIRTLENVLMTYAFYNYDLGYCQGMNDLVTPLMTVFDNEADVFWCFSALMDRVGGNFDHNQSSLHTQLTQIQILLRLFDPSLYSYLKSNEVLNLFFIFRWVLLQFKREVPFDQIPSLWEVLWTDQPCSNFHLLCIVGVLCQHSHHIISNRLAADEILKFANDLAGKMSAETLLLQGERMFLHYHNIANK